MLTLPTQEQLDKLHEPIKTWKERLFNEYPELKGKYKNDDSGALDEIGCWIKDEEIADLRNRNDALLALIDAHALSECKWPLVDEKLPG